MNIHRRVQLVASALVFGGALAIGVLTPMPAQAATCTPTECANLEAFADGPCLNACGSKHVGFTCPYSDSSHYSIICTCTGFVYPC
jgi:hypothetical protein